MEYYGISAHGKKSPENEDSYILPTGQGVDSTTSFGIEADFTAKGYLFLVCDGMGGHQAGEVASKLAVSWLWKDFYSDDEIGDYQQWLDEEITDLNSRLFNLQVEHDVYNGMGTTLVGAIVKDSIVYPFNVGDSRCYIINDGRIRQLTKDDSEVWKLYEKGAITKDELVYNRKGHLITQALALYPSLSVHTYDAVTISDTSKLLLCSDGLHDVLTDCEIADVVNSTKDLKKACKRLIKKAKKAGSKDDITVVMITN